MINLVLLKIHIRFEIENDGGLQVNFPYPSVLEHVVMPNDTIQGICLRYRVSAVELRRHNGFSGERDIGNDSQ